MTPAEFLDGILPAYRAQQDGVYIMWSSSSGLIGNIGQANYGAAKMGIAAFSRIIAMVSACVMV